MDVPELASTGALKARPKFLFFWRAAGSTGYLSQWWQSPFTVGGVTYATAEHYMMAGKARLFGDEATAADVLADPDPARAQALGRRVRGFDERTWAEHRSRIVVEGNLAKFTHHGDLRARLAVTRARVLVEASPLDRVWGIGLAADDERAGDPGSWRGLNLLGEALMTVRAALADEGSGGGSRISGS
ncbi:NADAR family protein [Actinomadura roseirufa]|uniref:NADAR family protein n=1 Tax=Actinomadura roseirufa TaxID=2094049 RepID=UPI00104176DA|nr:NADAR family protein [Actinomadura roseirufa]